MLLRCRSTSGPARRLAWTGLQRAPPSDPAVQWVLAARWTCQLRVQEESWVFIGYCCVAPASSRSRSVDVVDTQRNDASAPTATATANLINNRLDPVLPLKHRFSSTFRRVVRRTPWHAETDRVAKPASFTDLPGPEATLAIIQRHEALRRRGRPGFSVVVLDVGLPPACAQFVRQLMRPFRERARLGDEMGWLAPDRFALVLPLTGREGALRFVAELFSRLGEGYSTAPFDIFTA
jgi:hypothetical protein